MVDNFSHGSIDSIQTGLPQQLADFKNASARKAANKPQGKFYLYSLANSPPGTAVQDAGKLNFLAPPAVDIMNTRTSCAQAFNIPNMSTRPWCPSTLLDVGQLGNFYAQIAIAAAYAGNPSEGWDLPNAIYIDAVDVDGTLRIGTKPLTAGDEDPDCEVFEYTSCSSDEPSCNDGWLPAHQKEHWECYNSDGKENGFCGLAWQNHYKCCRPPVAGHDTARFAYVNTFIAVNIRRACGTSASATCASLKAEAEAGIAAYPKFLWNDPDTGRHDSWPVIKDIKFLYQR